MNSILCPHCNNEISIDEALAHKVSDKLEKSLRDEFNKKYLEERKKLEEKFSEKSGKEIEVLNEQLEKQKKELDKSREFELELRKKTAELEEKEKNLELEKQRQIDEERTKIREKTEEEMSEKYRLEKKQQEVVIESLKKSLEEAQRKASQGSQQLQGEVLELELEEVLKREFPIDNIDEVAKGKFGADVLQTVRDSSGAACGKIIWETKRTRNFEDGWIDKLKGDLSEAKADMAILVTSVLPKEIKIFGTRKGVYITSFECFIQVAQTLRAGLISLYSMKALSVGKNEKIESLYRYITSSEFAQKIDSMMETYQGMQNTLNKEKTALQKIWAQREKEIDRLKNSTLTIHGSLSGLIDTPLPEVKSMDFPEISDLED